MIVMRRVIGICVIVAVKIEVDVRVRMRRVVVRVRVRMDDRAIIARRTSAHSSPRAAYQARGRIDAEQNQHDCDREFHREPEPGWNRNFENYDRRSHQQHGQSVAESPYDTDSRGGAKPMLAAQDSGDGDHVIGIGRMAHPEHESEQCYRKRRGIGRYHRCVFLCRSIQPTVHPNFSLTEETQKSDTGSV
jgi:hypothetical protein